MTSAASPKLDDRFTREMTETVEGMRACGIIGEEDYKLTLRDLNGAPRVETVAPLTGNDIKTVRERANMSHAIVRHLIEKCSGSRPKG